MHKHSLRTRRYTLVEILVALVILILMMSFLFQFIIGAQKIWTTSHRTSILFDQTQLLFYLFENDLKSALLQPEATHPGQGMIGYLQTTTPNNQLHKFGLITQFTPPSADVGVFAVAYAYDGKVIRRKVLDDPSSVAWTFFGSPNATQWISFYESIPLGDDDILADGISSFSIEMSGFAGTTFDTMPTTAKLVVTAYDVDSVNALLSQGYDLNSLPVKTKIDETTRSFTKVIFLQ